MAQKFNVPEYRLKGADPDTVIGMLDRKEITEDEANDYVSFEDLRVNGFYGMEPESAEHLYARKHLTRPQIDEYMDYNESPTWFAIGDVAKRSVPHGVNEAVRNVWNFFREFTGADQVVKMAEKDGQRLPEVLRTPLAKPMPNIMPEPKTLAGDLGSGITEFVTPFIPASKLTKSSGIVAKIMQTGPMQALATKFPKLAQAAWVSLEGSIAGAAVDYMDDPFGGRLADLAKEKGWMPEFMEFMTTNPNNPASTERLKNVLEGIGMGTAVDGVLHLAKAFKAKYWAKNHNDAGWVAENFNKDFGFTDGGPSRAPSVDTGAMREDFTTELPASPAVAAPAPKEPIVVVKRKKVETPAPEATKAPELTPEDIAKAEPWQLTKEQYGQKYESWTMPSGKDVAENPQILGIEDMAKEDVKAMADALGLDSSKGKKAIGSDVRAIVMFKSYLEEVGIKGFKQLADDERQNLVRLVMGGTGKVGRGVGATPEKVFAKLQDRLSELEPIMRDHIARAKHSSAVRRAVGQGKDVPGYVLEQYRDTDWVKTYAKDRGLNISQPAASPKAEAPTPKPEAQPAPKPTEAPQPKPTEAPTEAPTVPPATTPRHPATVKETTTAIRIFKAQAGDQIRSIDDLIIDDSNFLQRIEAGSSHGTVALLNDIYREGAEAIEKFRARGSGSFANIERQSGAIWKRLGDFTGTKGQKTLDNFMSAAREIHTDMKHKAAQAHFLNEFITTYTSQVDELVEKAVRTQDRVLELQAITHIRQLQELTGLVMGTRAESGRLLNSYNMKLMKHPFDFDALPTGVLDDITNARGDEIRNALAAFHRIPKGATKDKLRVARALGKNRFLRGVLEYVQANLLWNPATHALNFAANSVNLVWRLFDRTMALGVHALTHRDADYLKAALAGWTGVLDGFIASTKFSGLIDAVKGVGSWKDIQPGNAWKSLWSGEGVLDTVLKEPGMEDSIINVALKGTLWGKTLAQIITLPFNGLAAGDELFKNMAYFSRLKEEAWNAAIATKKPGDNMKDTVKTILSNVPAELHYKALPFARKAAFQETPGEFTRATMKALSTGPGTVFRIFFMPFFKTPANIVRQAFEGTPLGLIQKEVRDALLDSGSIRQKEMISRMASTTLGITVVYQLYEAGLITGRKPRDQANAWDAVKAQEYSKWDGEKFVAYDRLDPAGMLMGMTADTCMLIDMIDHMDGDKITGEDIFAAATAALLDSSINKTWMTSVRDLVDLVTRPDRVNLGQVLGRQTEKFMPASSLFKFWNEQQDQYVRQYTELLDGWFAYTDRESMNVKRHVLYGSKVEREEKTLGILRTKTPDNDPVTRELLDIGVELKPMSKFIETGTGPTKVRREMTKAEWQKLNDCLERLDIKGTLGAIIADKEGYQKLQDADLRAEILKTSIENFRSAAKGIFMSESPEVIQEMKTKLEARAKALTEYHVNPNPKTRILHWNTWSTIGKEIPKQPE